AAERPGVHLVGVESAASPAVSSAVRAGRIVTVEVGPTIADGLGGNIEPGSVTPAVAGRRVDTWVQVPEDLLRTAVRLLATRCGLVVEGAGAVGVAALLGGLVEPAPGTAPGPGRRGRRRRARGSPRSAPRGRRAAGRRPPR